MSLCVFAMFIDHSTRHSAVGLPSFLGQTLFGRWQESKGECSQEQENKKLVVHGVFEDEKSLSMCVCVCECAIYCYSIYVYVLYVSE